MKEHIIRINGLEDYPRAAKEFTGFLEKGNIFAFYGKMGLLTTLNDGKPLNIKTGF